VKFLEPHYYIRFFDRVAKKTRFFLLLEREAPLKYPYKFQELEPGETLKEEIIFEELNPSDHHIYQAFLGIRHGCIVYVWHPYQEKILKFDESPIEKINEDLIGLEYRDSPYEDPIFHIWIFRDEYPGLVVKNILNRKIEPEIVWYCAKFTFEEVTEPVLLDKLQRHIIRSEPILRYKLD